jgi:hypothetical protein
MYIEETRYTVMYILDREFVLFNGPKSRRLVNAEKSSGSLNYNGTLY